MHHNVQNGGVGRAGRQQHAATGWPRCSGAQCHPINRPRLGPSPNMLRATRAAAPAGWRLPPPAQPAARRRRCPVTQSAAAPALPPPTPAGTPGGATAQKAASPSPLAALLVRKRPRAAAPGCPALSAALAPPRWGHKACAAPLQLLAGLPLRALPAAAPECLQGQGRGGPGEDNGRAEQVSTSAAVLHYQFIQAGRRILPTPPSPRSLHPYPNTTPHRRTWKHVHRVQQGRQALRRAATWVQPKRASSCLLLLLKLPQRICNEAGER